MKKIKPKQIDVTRKEHVMNVLNVPNKEANITFKKSITTTIVMKV